MERLQCLSETRRYTAARLAIIFIVSLFFYFIAPLYSAFPAQMSADAAELPDTVSASAALLVERDTGTILYEQNAHEKLFPASTTKILTAMLVLEAVDSGTVSLSDEITASSAMVNSVIWDASHVSPRIKIGETLTVEEYLYCVLLKSDCASCNILAEKVSGSVEEFVALMNKRAKELGCDNTHFANTHGYPDPNHYTTAWSIYLISAQAMKNPTFAKIVATKYHQVPQSNLARARDLYNTNQLLHNVSSTDYYYEYTTGIKTGTTDAAGYCLAASAEKDGMTLYSVVLGAQKLELGGGKSERKSFSETKRLFEWGYDSYAYYDILSPGTPVDAIDVANSGGKQAQLVPTQEQRVFLSKDALPSREINLSVDSLTAPVAKGTQVGEVIISLDGEILARSPLVVAENVAEQKPVLSVLSSYIDSSIGMPLLIGNCALLFAFLIVLIISSSRRSKRKKHRRAHKRESLSSPAQYDNDHQPSRQSHGGDISYSPGYAVTRRGAQQIGLNTPQYEPHYPQTQERCYNDRQYQQYPSSRADSYSSRSRR